MFDNAKYIVIKYGYNEVIIPFPGFMNHKDIADKMGQEVVSAGFIGEFFDCYGSSNSLNVSSRPKVDTMLLKMLFMLQDKHISYED